MKSASSIIIAIILVFNFSFGFLLIEEDILNASCSSFFTDTSKNIFSNPINITESIWWENIEVFDLDGNGYPEVITSRSTGDYSNPDENSGLYTVQLNRSGDWKIERINDTVQAFRGLIDIDSDGNIEIIDQVHSTIDNQVSLRISEYVDGNLTDSGIYSNFTNQTNEIIIGDIDSDGDYDISGATDTNNIFINRNSGGLNFRSGWDDGIPRRNFSDFNSNKFMSNKYGIWDINNDGHPDISSAMGMGKALNNPGTCQYYNWISDGNGTWTDHSDNFPFRARGVYLDLADIDNDGDLDYALATETTNYIFENKNGKEWIQRPWVNTITEVDSFIFNDFNGDGFNDLLTIDNMEGKDNQFHPIFKNYVNISFGDGKFNWNTIPQFSINGGRCSNPIIADMDRDGDEDLVLSFNRYVDGFGEDGSILFIPNQAQFRSNMTIIETPNSPHLRSGSIHRISWTKDNGSEIISKDINFNLSISYTGQDGPFSHLKKVVGKWWTDIHIPDFPSNDVYFRVNYSDLFAFSGPYTIHDENELSSFVEMINPEFGAYFIEEDEMEIILRTSEHLTSGTYPTYLVWGVNRTFLGSYRLDSDSNNSFTIDLPSGAWSEYCYLEVNITWQGFIKSIDTVSRFSVISKDLVPHIFNSSQFKIPQGVETTIFNPVISLNGSDMSTHCEYEIWDFSEGITIKLTGDGRIHITCLEKKEYVFKMKATSYIWFIEINITINSLSPLDSISLIVNDNDPRIGQEIEVFYRGKDHDGNFLYIGNEYINWTISGDCGYEVENGAVMITPWSNSEIQIEARTDVGLGLIQGQTTITAGNFLQDIRIIPDSDIMKNGTFQTISVSAITYNSIQMEVSSVGWEVGPNARIVNETDSEITIEAMREGPIEVIANMSHFDEFVRKSIFISVTPAPVDIRIGKQMVQEVGTTSIYEMDIITSSEVLYDDEFHISYSLEDPSLASVSIDGNELIILGEREGITDLILHLTTDEGISFERTFPVEIRSTPVTIKISELPDQIKVGEEIEFKVSPLNYEEDQVHGFKLIVKSDKCDIVIDDDYNVRLISTSIGADKIEIIVEKYGKKIHYTFNLDIIPIAKNLKIYIGEFEIIIGDDFTISVELLDINGNKIEWNEFHIETPAGINIVSEEGDFILNSSRRGDFEIDIWTDYFGNRIENSINVTIFERSLLTEIFLQKIETIVEVICVDQFGNNITEDCNITWTGKYEEMEPYKIMANSRLILVNVTYNGTSLESTIEVDLNNEQDGIDPITPILFGSVIILIAAGIFLYFKKRAPEQVTSNEEIDTED